MKSVAIGPPKKEVYLGSFRIFCCHTYGRVLKNAAIGPPKKKVYLGSFRIFGCLKNATIGRHFKIYTPGPMAAFFRNAAIGSL